MKTTYLLFLLCFPLFLQAQKRSLPVNAQEDSIYVKASSITNSEYVQIYFTSVPMSFLAPGGEIGAPHKYVLSADINPYFSVLGGHFTKLSIALHPNTKVRIRANTNPGDSSLPVRTPSYNIGGILYWRLAESVDRFQYVSGAFYHHSNGQDGPALDKTGNFNTYNGNFSTNYLNFKFNFGKQKADSLTLRGVGRDFFKPKRYQVYTFEQKSLGVEWHPPFFAHESALEGKYGFLKLRFDYLWLLSMDWDVYRTILDPSKLNQNNNPTKRKVKVGTITDERLRAVVNFSYILNRLDDYSFFELKKRLNIEAAIHYAPPFTRNSALFIGIGYKGEDEYNIYFQDRYFYFRTGLSSGFLRYDTKLKNGPTLRN